MFAGNDYGIAYELMQRAAQGNAPLAYYVFDLLFLGDKDMRKLPLLKRRSALEPLLPKRSAVRFSAHIKEKGISYFNAAKRRHLEGVMAKRAAGLYYSGKRTRAVA